MRDPQEIVLCQNNSQEIIIRSFVDRILKRKEIKSLEQSYLEIFSDITCDYTIEISVIEFNIRPLISVCCVTIIDGLIICMTTGWIKEINNGLIGAFECLSQKIKSMELAESNLECDYEPIPDVTANDIDKIIRQA